MQKIVKLCAAMLGALLLTQAAMAQVLTPGTVTLTATLNNLSNSGTQHTWVVWVTDSSNVFIKTLRKQKSSFTGDWSEHNHYLSWNTARAGSTVLDGYSSATPISTYSANEVVVTWNCMNAANTALVPDGNYKFYIQYNENDIRSDGPVTTGGLTWTKGTSATSVNPTHSSNVGSPTGGLNFTAMSIVWTPLAPEIAVEESALNIADGGTVNFGSVAVGTPLQKTFTVKNTGTATLTLTTPAVKDPGTYAAEYVVSAIPTSVTAGSSATFTVTFTPAAAGTGRTAAIHITNNDADESPFDINLTGAGVTAPEIAVEESAVNIADGGTVDFGSVGVGTPLQKTFTVKNTGTAILNLTTPATTNGTSAAEYVVSAIPTSVLAGNSATFTVTFTPLAVGSNRTAAIHITNTDSNESPFDINLTGAGGAVPEIAVEQPPGTNLTDGSATPINCGSANVGIPASPVTTFTVFNRGTAVLNTLSITKDVSANSGDFVVSSIASSVPVGTSGTTFTVTFTPGGAGTRTATIHIISNDGDENPFDINLTGTGLVPEIAVEYPLGTDLTDGSAIPINFGTVNLGQASSAFTFTVKNTGGAPLTLTNPIINNGTNPGDFIVSALAATSLPATTDNTTFTVTFTPLAVGTRTTVIRITNTDSDENPFDINLTGTAENPVYTAGSVNLKATLHDFAGDTGYPNTADHMAVVWVTSGSGTFIKTLWKQGPADFNDAYLAEHFNAWNTARAGSTVLDGYSGATAMTYAAPNSPIDITWNCKDASNKLVPDGDYRFWIQYTERMDGEAPVTVNGLKWTKGPGTISNTYPDAGTKGGPQGGFNFTALAVSSAITFPDWATTTGLPAGHDYPTHVQHNDGVTNLEKFAFNLDGTKADCRKLTVGTGGTTGLPGGAKVGGALRLEFLRRKAGTNPGITYTPQFSSGMGSWTDFAGTGSVSELSPVSQTWERVVVDDTVTGQPKRFGRVKLLQP